MNDDEMVRNVEEAVNGAKGIAFDGCHKIYILLDDEQVNMMCEYGYGDDDSDYLITSDEMSADEMFQTVMNWYGQSCSLKFVSAVETVKGDANEGFHDVIPQGAEDEDEDECCYRCASDDTLNTSGLCDDCEHEDNE